MAVMRKPLAGTAAAVLAGLLLVMATSPASAQTLTWKITPGASIKGNAGLLGVSCPSASFCVAAGYSGVPVHLLIESWNGKIWSIARTPSAPNSELWSVSCPSAGFCMAAGFTQLVNGATAPVAEKWNGRRWSAVPPPAGNSGELTSVSCATASVCTAVGSEANGRGGTKNFAEEWNGTKWSVMPAPPDKGGAVGDLLNGVSCPSANDCTAVGDYGFLPMYPLIESWNGTKWSIVPSPKKANASVTEVSCATARSCNATGDYLDRAANGRPYAETWNGKSWAAAPISGPKYGQFNDVTCVSADNCTGAGYDGPGRSGTIQSLIWSWNGKIWSAVSTPSPSKEQPNQLFGMACASARACTAVGFVAPYGSNKTKSLIESGRAAG